MSETKRFHIGDILSVTDGRLVSLDHVGGVYNILGWMTGEDLMTHQLPRVSDECRPTLLAAFPDLATLPLPLPEVIRTVDDLRPWFDAIEADGMEMWREVPKVKDGAHARIDPLLELQHKIGAGKVIPVVVR